MGRELRISKKDSVELCRHIKGMPLDEAQTTLRAIANGETPVPLKKHNSGVGHRSGIDGWDAGRFPKKASEAIYDVLYNAESNAENQGYDPGEMVVEHIAAHKVGEARGMKPRAMGRASPWNSDLVDIEVVLLQEDYDPSEVPDEEREEEAEAEDEAAEPSEEPEETESEAEEEVEAEDDEQEAEDEADAGEGDDEEEAAEEEEAEADDETETEEAEAEDASEDDEEAGEEEQEGGDR